MAEQPTEAPTVRREPDWCDLERSAWRWPERIALPAWAEKYRWLSPRQSDIPGPWRNYNNPASVGVMVVVEKPGVRQVTLLKHSQGGYSELLRNLIGKLAHLMPVPVLIVLPDKEKGRSIVQKRLIPLFQDTPVLRQLGTGRRWDQKTNGITLANGFELRLGYSGSITSVASDPACVAICDERSKFQDDGKVSIADSIRARTARFENSLIVNLSTPGAEPDPTTELFESASTKLFYWITCPHCGRHQRLTFDSLKWTPKKADEPDKTRRAESIRLNRSAWIECENPVCVVDGARGRMADDQQARLVRAGFWAPEDHSWKCFGDGREEGTFPRGTTVGMLAPAFTSLAPGHRWSEIAALFAEAEGDHAKTVGFYNELLAQVYHVSTHNVVADVFQAKCRPDAEAGFIPPKRGVLPKWAARLVMTVDTQKDHFYYVVRAYGAGGRSRRVAHGKVLNFEALTALADQARWPYEDSVFAPAGVYKTAIDSGGGKMGTDGSRTDAVYRWCLIDPIRRLPLKGEDEPKADQPMRHRRIASPELAGRRQAYEVFLWLFNSHYYNDLLASDIAARIDVIDPATGEVTGQVDRWELNDDPDDEYCRQLANMKKALTRSRGREVERWIKKTSGARVDYRACEYMQQAMAHGPAGCMALPTAEQMVAMAKAPRTPAASGGIRMPDGRAFGVWNRK